MTPPLAPRPEGGVRDVVEVGPRPVVLGIDASGTSVAALTWACGEARRAGLALHVLHAHSVDVLGGAVGVLYDQVDQDALTEAAEATVAAAVEWARVMVPDTRVTGSVVLGPAAEVLLEHTGGATLLVLGSHGRGALARVAQGSVALRVAAHARCPVVVLPPAVEALAWSALPASRHRGKRIVAGIDGNGPHTEAVLRFAFEQAAARGAFLEVVTTWEFHRDLFSTVPEKSQEGEHRLVAGSELLLAELVTPWADRYPDVHVQRNAVEGAAVASLVRRGSGAELLVVGSHGRNAVAALLLGSVSAGIVQHADCPVAVVRPQR